MTPAEIEVRKERKMDTPMPNWRDILKYDGRLPEPPYDEPTPSRQEALEELYSICCQWYEGGHDRFPLGIVKQLEAIRDAPR